MINTISYEQTIHAYPGGGGAYIVARDNLGELPAQTAGAALLTDYILTVAVSISSGVAFAIPTYYFVILMLITVGVGMLRWATGGLGFVVAPPELEVPLTFQVVTPFLLLHALANGTSALTGIEAISNGITAFKEPRSRNAGITLIWMASILGVLRRAALTHLQIIRKVWGAGYGENEAHLLRVNISNLRRKIEKDPTRPAFIVTEPGVGYRFRFD